MALKLDKLEKNRDDEDVWVLTINKRIDYETQPISYTFDVKVDLTKTVTFIVKIENIDDNPPIITSDYRNCKIKVCYYQNSLFTISNNQG